MNLPSKLLEEAVEQFATLPGVGKRTALRLVLNMLNREADEVQRFSEAITNLKNNIVFCRVCHNIADNETCAICSNPKRDEATLCVVEDIRDIMAIENTQQFFGKYHVLGGVISPIDGIGPQDLNIETLLERANAGAVKEIILALSTTMEGDTTNFFLYKKLSPLGISVSTLARGVAVGDELEYADELTLGRSIVNRTPYEGTLSR